VSARLEPIKSSNCERTLVTTVSLPKIPAKFLSFPKTSSKIAASSFPIVNGETSICPEVFVSRHAAFFRAIFVPSLASAISDAARRQAFADCLEQKLKQRLSERRTPFHSFVQVMVLAKQGPAVIPSARSGA
jgi:hypothetical protein